MFSSLRSNDDILRNIRDGLAPANHNVPYLCGICNKNVNTKAVFCNQCDK